MENVYHKLDRSQKNFLIKGQISKEFQIFELHICVVSELHICSMNSTTDMMWLKSMALFGTQFAWIGEADDLSDVQINELECN